MHREAGSISNSTKVVVTGVPEKLSAAGTACPDASNLNGYLHGLTKVTVAAALTEGASGFVREGYFKNSAVISYGMI